MDYLGDSDVEMERRQGEPGPTESHEVEIWQEPSMSLEPEQESQEEVKEQLISLSATPRQPELQPAAVVPVPANQEQQQPGPSTAATQGNLAVTREHPSPGHRVQIPKFLDRVKGHVWFGNSLPRRWDLEDEGTRENLRSRFYGEMRKLKIEWSKSAVMVSETKGTTIDGNIKSMTFTVGLRVDKRESFVDHELGTTTVITRPGDGSQFVFNILNQDLSKKIDLSVGAMVRASEVVFGMKLVKSSKAMDLLIDSSDSE